MRILLSAVVDPLVKSSGGVRPIVMCEVAAKAAAAIVAAAGDAPRCKLMPQQFGAGTPSGALQMAEEAIDEAHHSPHRV
eukprot:820795-Alexandrium_andersonii.AAC.1